MIKVTIREAAEKRGIKSAYELAQAMGDGESRKTATHLWSGGWPRPETLDRVARALGDCDLSELIARTPSKKRREPPTRRSRSKKNKR